MPVSALTVLAGGRSEAVDPPAEAASISLHELVRECFDFVQQRQPDAPAARVIDYFESVHPNREVSQATMYRIIKACKQASVQRQLVHNAKGLPLVLEQLERERDAHQETASELLHLKARVSTLEQKVASLMSRNNSPARVQRKSAPRPK